MVCGCFDMILHPALIDLWIYMSIPTVMYAFTLQLILKKTLISV